MAIGNPWRRHALQRHKGLLVSAFEHFPNAVPGTWIRRTTPINPGTVAVPAAQLLAGEVIGITSQKTHQEKWSQASASPSKRHGLLGRPPSLSIRQRPVPLKKNSQLPLDPWNPSPLRRWPKAFGTLVLNEPKGAEIWLDHAFVGNVPPTTEAHRGAGI